MLNDLEELNHLRRLAKSRFTAIIIALVLGILTGVFRLQAWIGSIHRYRFVAF